MPVGTKITAVRDGVIIKVVENNDRNCAQEECKKYNNSILIYHPDGTFAEYAHIKYNGSLVKVGDKIAQNQILGYSGNVGWSTGPHLHLAIFLQGINKRKTLKTKFKTDNGKAAEFLEEGADYSKNY